jgi:hypothetical protein
LGGSDEDKPVDLSSLSALEDRVLRLEAVAEQVGVHDGEDAGSREVHGNLQTAEAHGTARFLVHLHTVLCCALQDHAAAGNGVHAHLHSHAHKPEDEDLKAIFDLQESDLAENKIDMPTGLGNCTMQNLAVLQISFIWPKLARGGD